MQNNADKLLKPPLDGSLVVPMLTLDLAFYKFFNIILLQGLSVIFYHALVAPYSITNEVPVELEGLSFEEGVKHSPLFSAVGFHCISLPQQ